MRKEHVKKFAEIDTLVVIEEAGWTGHVDDLDFLCVYSGCVSRPFTIVAATSALRAARGRLGSLSAACPRGRRVDLDRVELLTDSESGRCRLLPPNKAGAR